MTTPAITADRGAGTLPTEVDLRRVSRTSSRRWGIAVAVAAAALLGTAGAFLLAAGSAPTARLAGWAPAGTVAYAEMRLDAPSEQDGATARFLANFPGFADRTRLDQKLTELGDRLLDRATDGELDYSSMKPWLGDAAALAIPRVPASPSDGTGVLVVATTDSAALRDWIAKNVPAGGTTETYAGVQLTTGTERGMAWAYTVLDTVLLAGEKGAVTAAIDTGGRSAFATNDRFRTALGSLDPDSIGFAYLDGASAVDELVAALPADAPASAEADLRAAMPAWVVAGVRPTDDALEATVVAPRPALLGDGSFPAPTNATSRLAARLPADTLMAAESRAIGDVLVALAARTTTDGASGATGDGADALLGLVGSADAIVGWMGDGALVVLPGATSIETGVVALVSDEAAATATTRQLRALLSFASRGEGIAFTSEPYGDGEIVTLVVEDPASFVRSAATALGQSLPDGIDDASAGTKTGPTELSWTVQRGLFVTGTTPAFVKAIVDGPTGGSLADSARYQATLGRVGSSNAGQVYLDVPGLVARLLPMLPADERATYDRDLAPFVDAFDAAGGALLAGDAMRVQFLLTVK